MCPGESATEQAAPVPPAIAEDAVAQIPAESDLAVDDEIHGEGDNSSINTSSTASLIDYWGPNDEKQNDALDFNHYWMTDFLNGELTLAPIGNTPHSALDIGTGTGIWAIDFADKYPSSDVIGVDISPIQPAWVPSNCRFQIDDFEKEWTWPVDYFGLIHGRNLEACISDVPRFFEQAFAHTRPNGWIEIKEIDTELRSQSKELTDDHIYRRWYTNLVAAATRLGKEAEAARNGCITRGMAQAGYVDIVEKKWKIPIGGWSADPKLKHIGQCTLEFIDQSMEGFGLFLLKEVMGFTYEEVVVIMSEVRAALRDRTNQTYYYLHIIYARKPGSPGQDSSDSAVAA
ncbi:methyltransferase [Colletotrichum navitas]|uniref:Methyltransferase n=1 Tax=Colletotrichum navitas TaxID=681940 RepID=A0AAD8PVL0_9PEZI|nr:methyltransferase [Colletotrichum navitas]KAK1585446.1 methyltransferase [Colletotrichum navitas]